MPNFIYPPLSVNMPQNTAVMMRLTDNDDATYDWRFVAPGDVGLFNAIVQEDTDGELWWEVFDDFSPDGPMRHTVELDMSTQEIEFDNLETARQFKQLHPRWRVLFTTTHTVEVL